jgi:hypothetical protein
VTETQPINHGAPGSGGAQAHRRRGEDPCDECARAAAQYTADYRRRFPERYAAAMEKGAAQNRALWRLAGRHKEEFDALTESELLRGRYERR